jgi:hypothetical protein
LKIELGKKIAAEQSAGWSVQAVELKGKFDRRMSGGPGDWAPGRLTTGIQPILL